jgi:hypothetical protein
MDVGDAAVVFDVHNASIFRDEKYILAVQNYKVYFGLYPSSGMYKTKNHNVSETGSVSVLRWIGQDRPTQLSPLERASLNHWTNHAQWRTAYKH